MSIRNLSYLFKPDSIALIGAGCDVEAVVARNLMDSGFKGPVMPVDSTRHALGGALTYLDVASLPLTPDLAVITSPLNEVPALIGQLGARGVRAAVIISEYSRISNSAERETLDKAILAAAKPYALRILGPGSMGLSVPAVGFNASLSQYQPLTGNVAFVTQSSAITQAALDWSSQHGFGFSHLINVGEAIDVDFADILDYLTGEYRIRAILLYLERIRDPRKFMSAARQAARVKPVIILRPRRYTQDDTDDAVYSAAFRRAGILRVDDRHELFNLVEVLNNAKLVRNDRLAIVSNSHSLSLLAADTLYHYGGRLAQFSEATQQGLEVLMDVTSNYSNPVDLGDHAGPEAYGKALDLLLKDRGVDGVLVIKAPSAFSEALPIADEINKRLPGIRCCILASFPGLSSGEAARRRTTAQQVPTYETSNGAVRAFMRMVQYKHNQKLLMETPPSMPEVFTPETETGRHIISRALTDGRERLNESEAMQLLAAYKIPVVETLIARGSAEAAEIATRLGQAVTLKILSPDIAHKSQVGGVVRYLDSPETVQQAANAMLVRVRNLAPAARLQGFLVQPMENRDGAYEIKLGVRPGGHFGPVIYFGQGGTEAEVIGDIAYGLPPLNMNLAWEIMSQTRIYRLLRYSLLRRANLNALALTLIKISQIVIDLGEIVEIDINPLRVNAQGVLALDARVRVAAFAGKSSQRLAISPYPKELEEHCSLSNGHALLLRPILPEDEPALQALVQRASPEDLRLRFLQPIRELSHDMAARMTQIDYNREMALVAVGSGLPGKAEVYGVVNISADPDNDKAEYSIIVERALMRLGLGTLMMRRIIDYARRSGIREIYGAVLQENEAMLQLNRALGFTVKIMPDDPGLRQVTLRLQ
jgi:acetyltransferase